MWTYENCRDSSGQYFIEIYNGTVEHIHEKVNQNDECQGSDYYFAPYS